LESILRAENIYKDYPAKSGRQHLNVLTGVNFEIPRGHIISIVGPSGCGKSTLLHILGGLDKPTSGSVFFGDKDISKMNAPDLASFRNKNMGFVFQFHHLLPEFTALENVFMPGLIQGLAMDQLKKRALELLSHFNLDDRADHRPSELSGGEQQRVAVARAMMNEPEMILADEPTGNLDEENTEIMLGMLFNLRKNGKLSIVIVTHDRSIAEKTNIIFELRKGKLHKVT